MLILWFVVGLVALVAGAEFMVRGASRIAEALGISPLLIGLTIVSLGTSAPEIAVSVQSSLSGSVDLAIGNVVGSNIMNVLLILGVSALIIPLDVHRQLIRQEIPIMIGASMLLVVMTRDFSLDPLEAGFLLVLLIGYLMFLIRTTEREELIEPSGPSEAGVERALTHKWYNHWLTQSAWIVVGVALLVKGSDWLVYSALETSKLLNIPESIVGLTVVAVGTSLPEIATSIIAALKGQRDIAVGNVIGSNIFNILGCLGVAGVISTSGLTMSPGLANFDMWVMLAVAFACIPVFASGRQISKPEGILFLGYYVLYTAYLILDNQGHEYLGYFNKAMMSFVIPLTLAALVASMLPKTKSKDA